MRLIDADTLIKDLSYLYKNHIPVDMRARETLSTVMEQPTAYDVDAVVDQLRKQQEKLETDIFAKESDNWYGQYCNGIHEGIDKAIEIVKAGGEDAKTDS